MLEKRGVDLVRELYAAMNERDVARATAMLDPEAEWSPDPRTGIRPKRGRDEIVAFFLDQAEMFGEVRIEVDELREAGETVCALIRVFGSGFASGAGVEIQIAHLWNIRDGKITRGEGFGDRARALEAAGLAT